MSLELILLLALVATVALHFVFYQRVNKRRAAFAWIPALNALMAVAVLAAWWFWGRDSAMDPWQQNLPAIYAIALLGFSLGNGFRQQPLQWLHWVGYGLNMIWLLLALLVLLLWQIVVIGG